jgi:hypothetical protein
MEHDDPHTALMDAVKIEPLALQEEFVRLPSDLAYWNARYADAQRTFLVRKLELDQLNARLRIELRERLLVTESKVTESMVDSRVELDDRYGNARLAMVEAEADKMHKYGAVDALRAKRDMLVSLGAHVRAEMQHDPQLRDESRGAKLNG